MKEATKFHLSEFENMSKTEVRKRLFELSINDLVDICLELQTKNIVDGSSACAQKFSISESDFEKFFEIRKPKLNPDGSVKRRGRPKKEVEVVE